MGEQDLIFCEQGSASYPMPPPLCKLFLADPVPSLVLAATGISAQPLSRFVSLLLCLLVAAAKTAAELSTDDCLELLALVMLLK